MKRVTSSGVHKCSTASRLGEFWCTKMKRKRATRLVSDEIDLLH